MLTEQIPANIDHVRVLADLNAWGYRDYRIEAICGFSVGYVSQLKCGNVKQMTYQRAARLWNFWCEEHDSRGTLQTHSVAVSSSS